MKQMKFKKATTKQNKGKQAKKKKRFEMANKKKKF